MKYVIPLFALLSICFLPVRGVTVKKGRMMSDSANISLLQAKVRKGLTIAAIRDGIDGVLERQKAKLISQTSKPESMEMKVKTADQRLLSLQVNKTESGYDLSLSDLDSENKQKMSVLDKQYYTKDINRFLDHSLKPVRPERKLFSFANYEALMELFGFTKMDPQPNKADNTSSYFEIMSQERGERDGYVSLNYDQNKGEIYIEFYNVLMSELKGPIGHHVANMIYKIEAVDFSERAFNKISPTEKNIFLAKLTEGKEKLKEFIEDNPEMGHQDPDKITNKVKDRIKGLFGDKLSLIETPFESLQSFSFDVQNPATASSVGRIIVNIFPDLDEYEVSFIGAHDSIRLAVPFLKVTETFNSLLKPEEENEEVDLNNSVSEHHDAENVENKPEEEDDSNLGKITALFTVEIMNLQKVFDAIEENVLARNCLLKEPEDQEDNVSQLYQINKRFLFEDNDAAICSLEETYLTLIIYNFRFLKIAHLKFENRYLEAEYTVSLTNNFANALDHSLNHFFEENDAILEDFSKSKDNHVLKFEAFDKVIEKVAPELICNTADDVISCTMNKIVVLKVIHILPKQNNPEGQEFFNIQFLKDLRIKKPKQDDQVEFAFPELMFQPVNGYEQLAAVERQIKRFVKFLEPK